MWLCHGQGYLETGLKEISDSGRQKLPPETQEACHRGPETFHKCQRQCLPGLGGWSLTKTDMEEESNSSQTSVSESFICGPEKTQSKVNISISGNFMAKKRPD